MKLKIPFIGFIEKTIHTDFIQAILRVFRETEDKHRVLVMVPLTLLISHSYFMSMQPHIQVIFHNVSRSEGFWLALAGFSALFVFAWAVLSSPFNPALYVRQTIFIIWTGLLHRLGYGLETLGTMYITTVSFLALSSFLPFAFTGMTIPQLFNRLKDDYQSRKTREPAVVEIPPKPESEAA